VRIAAVAVVRRYNEIPPRSVIGQETYGNEVWEIVSEDGIVMIQATVLGEPCASSRAASRLAV
jgi:hypothetical protein